MGQRPSAENLGLSALELERCHSLLAWWEVHGCKVFALKPWMFTKDGRGPEPHEHLDVLECWIAEAILQTTGPRRGHSLDCLGALQRIGAC